MNGYRPCSLCCVSHLSLLAESNISASEKDANDGSSLPEFPLHLLPYKTMKSRPVFLHALKLRQQTALAARPAVLRQTAYRPLSTSPRLFNQQQQSTEGQQQNQKSQKEQEKEKARKQRAEEEELNAPPQSPFKVFAQVLKEEISKNKAWQDNVKQLQGDVDKLADSQAMKRAREVYERARVCPLLKARLTVDHKPDQEQS
jgi:import inner membrane translocase subunit TIM44